MEQLYELEVTVKIETNKESWDITFYMHSDETLDQFLNRVKKEVKQELDNL